MKYENKLTGAIIEVAAGMSVSGGDWTEIEADEVRKTKADEVEDSESESENEKEPRKKQRPKKS